MISTATPSATEFGSHTHTAIFNSLKIAVFFCFENKKPLILTKD